MSVAGKPQTTALAETGAGILRAPRTRAASLRLFASPAGQQKVRRATDVLALVPALLALGLLATAQPPQAFEQSLIAFIGSLPGWLDPVWGLIIAAFVVWLVVLIVATAYRRRWRMLLQAALAVCLAVLVGAVAARIAAGAWPDIDAALGRHAGDPPFPEARLAFATALLLTLNGHVVRPARRLGDRLLVFGALAVACGQTATPGAVLAATLVGAAAAAGSRLLLGTSAGRPSVDDVTAALGELGIAADELTSDDLQTAGVVRLHTGDGLLVKVYGRDAYDNQLLSRFWRMLWYRDAGPDLALSRASAVEHEAFLTLLARGAGVPTAEVVTAGETSTGDALLVLRASGTPLGELTADAVPDALLERAWQALTTLGGVNIAHLQLEPGVLVVSGEVVELREFAGATVAADASQLTRDRAQLLASTAVVVGPERALRAAVAALGTDEASAMLPYLQEAAFGASLRKAMKAVDLEADDLRAAAAEAVGTAQPTLVKLRRVTWGSVAQSALLVLAATAVFSYLGQVDFDELRSDLEGAQWGWIAAGAIVAQLPRLAQAYATLGSVPQPLPYGPVYAMQLATGYLNLALPSSLARMAISVRFFQRQGVAPATAVASGLVDSLANNVVQALLLLLLLLFSQASVNLGVSSPDSSGGSNLLWLLVGIGVVVVVASVIAAVVIPRVRHLVVDKLRHWIPQIRSTFAGLRSPKKLWQLISGNVASEILFATALGMMAMALGYHISLVDLLVINLSVSLFASFIPIPGGIGVVEGGLMVGLSGLGVPQSAALAIAILYRMCTFYLPPIAGWFAMRWLTRNSYL